jgi:hypothetical protein
MGAEKIEFFGFVLPKLYFRAAGVKYDGVITSIT